MPVIVLLVIVFAVKQIVVPSPQAKGREPEINSTALLSESQAGGLPGLMAEVAPWPAEINNLEARLRAMGEPLLNMEGNQLHIHEHLDVFVDGQVVAVPPGIGIGKNQSFFAVIHTHEKDQIIHVESPEIKDYFLGMFFDIWGVRFNDDCLGGHCRDGDKKLKVFVNGTEVNDNFRQVKLESQQQIVVAYGTEQELPNPIPVTYTFPPGY
jgi:hypothetical protein